MHINKNINNQSENHTYNAEFSDANAKFYCRIYYAEEFHKMREEIMESSEDDFVRSLSHCVNWQARGGKSGAVFYATEGTTVEDPLRNVFFFFIKVVAFKWRLLGCWMYFAKHAVSPQMIGLFWNRCPD